MRVRDHRVPILAACLMATFMPAVESTIVATAMPTIVADLGGFGLFSWVFTIYLLTQAVSIPLYGRLADLHGRKPVFFFGAGLFLAGSAASGFAWGMVPLIVFRAIQGLGAGAVMPSSATILGDIYAPDRAGAGAGHGVLGVRHLRRHRPLARRLPGPAWPLAGRVLGEPADRRARGRS